MSMLKPDSLIGRLFYYAAVTPDHDAVVSSTLTLSYAQLAQLVRFQVKAFHAIDMSSHAVIGIKCADDIQHLVLCLATTYIGATSCTIPSYEADETQHLIVEQCGATYLADNSLVKDMSRHDVLESIAVDVPTSHAGLLFSTSGTTGKPKLVIHHDADLVAQAHRHIQSEQERFVCLASMEHNFAKRHRLYCVAAGATNVFLGTNFKTRQETLVSQVESLKVNVMHLSAFQAQELVALPGVGGLSHIRLKLGGSHVPLSLRKKLRDNITQQLQAGYGTTETGAIAFTDPNDLNAGESVGQALPGIDLCIVSPERESLGAGERGELAVRSDGMFRAYLGNPEMTAKRLENGWFYTGDIAYLDEKQRVHLCGRSDDMFVFNSMNIYPQDIESELCQFRDIIDAAVFPKASTVHGNIPVALVVYAKGVKPDLIALKKFIKKRVGVRRPRQFNIVNEIPRNAAGKIARHQVMSLSVDSEQIRQTIAKILEQGATNQLMPSVISAFKAGEKDIKISTAGLDSLARMELLVALEIKYDTVILLGEFARFRFFGNIVSHVLLTQSQAALLSRQQTQQDQIAGPFSRLAKSRSKRTESKPYVVRFFQRIFSYCGTAVQFNKALRTLGYRLTPLEWDTLIEWHANGDLISSSTALKFESVLVQVLNKVKMFMHGSGKQTPEPFISQRVAPTVRHFFRPGLRSEKTLLICFSGRGGRQLSILNAVLMQYTDSTQFDLLVISEPLAESYTQGVPFLGKNEEEVVDWLAKLDLVRDYGRIRTLGYSAGGYPAIMSAYRLDAEMVVSMSCRFLPDKRLSLIKYMARLIRVWRAVHKGHCACVLLSYSLDISRDHKFARMAAWLSGGKQIGLELTKRKVHLILSHLASRGELKAYLDSTIFTELSDELMSPKREKVIMNFTDIKDNTTISTQNQL